jgi:hypothetical protein
MEIPSIFDMFILNLREYNRCVVINQDEFERQLAIYNAEIAQIRFVERRFENNIKISPHIELPELFFQNHCNVLLNASAYILYVDKKLRNFGLEEEIDWNSGYCDELCSHSMICNIFRNFSRWDIDEADQMENLKYALQERKSRIYNIWRALNNYNIVSSQYIGEAHERIVQQALEILNYNYNRPSQTFANLIGLDSFSILSDDRLIELASEIATAASDKEDLELWRDQELDLSEENADYLALEMGEELTFSTKKVSKGRRLNKKVKRYP